MQSKTKVILLVIAGVLVAALIIIVILYYMGYFEASAYGNQGPRGPYCPSTCSFDKDGKIKVKVYNTRAKRYQPNVYMTFKTEDCNGAAAHSTPEWDTHCTTNSDGECSVKVCIGGRAALYKITGAINTPARCHFVTEPKSVLIWGGALSRNISGQVECFW